MLSFAFSERLEEGILCLADGTHVRITHGSRAKPEEKKHTTRCDP